jgi:internalin A
MKKITYITTFIAILGIALFSVGCTKVGQPSSSNEPTGVTPQTDMVSTSLNLSNTGLTKLPDYVLDMTQLKELNLSSNQMTGSLPAEIRKLKNLEKLNLSNNEMSGIPAEIGQLEKLQELDLSNNLFTGLPYEIGDLTNLETLKLTGNDYSEADLNIILEKLPNLNVIK